MASPYWPAKFTGFFDDEIINGTGGVYTKGSAMSAPITSKSVLEACERVRETMAKFEPLVGAIVTDRIGLADLMRMCRREAEASGHPYLGSIPVHREETAAEAEALAEKLSEQMRVMLFLDGKVRDIPRKAKAHDA